MASIVLVCKEAREDSLFGNVALGLQLAAAGDDVAIVFTGEALKALTGETWYWPALLRGRAVQVGIARAGNALGYELNAAFDARWLDSDRFLRQAAAKGLELLACPVWSGLLDVAGQFPDCVAEISMDAYLARLRSADRVIGGY